MHKPLRKIIHLDLDAFFCAAEELKDPSLRGTAFAVGGRPETRGVVSSCSYAARQHGVRSAMPMARAIRLCPGLTVVPPRHGYYSELSDQVMQRIGDLTPLVEPLSIDEAFLDVSDLPDPPREIAQRLQARIFEELHLPASLGAASNKLVSKIATDVGKAANRGPNAPMAITVVPPGEEAAFLAPLPVEALWGVGPKTAAHLNQFGIHTIGDEQPYPLPLLKRHDKRDHLVATRPETQLGRAAEGPSRRTQRKPGGVVVGGQICESGDYVRARRGRSARVDADSTPPGRSRGAPATHRRGDRNHGEDQAALVRFHDLDPPGDPAAADQP